VGDGAWFAMSCPERQVGNSEDMSVSYIKSARSHFETGGWQLCNRVSCLPSG